MKENLQKLRKMFLYAGMEKEEYNSLQSSIHNENLTLLRVFSIIAGIMFSLLFVASLVTKGFANVNSFTYMMCAVVMLVIMICVKFLASKYPALVNVLVYLFEIVLYVFSIRISMLHADKPAVSAVAFLLVTPLLFYDCPVRLSALIVTDVVVFCVMVCHIKASDVVETDVWNMVTFGVVAVVTSIFIMSIKVRALIQRKQIEYLSQTDLLTGLKNRNHYEEQLEEYPRLFSSYLVYVYADVNGLHELNNSQGHSAGDKMLREVALTMQDHFGTEHTYRIGGDEFAAFGMDVDPAKIYDKIEYIQKTLSDKGYYVSFGTAARNKKQDPFDIQEMIKEAETAMYSAKEEFYRQHGDFPRVR